MDIPLWKYGCWAYRVFIIFANKRWNPPGASTIINFFSSYNIRNVTYLYHVFHFDVTAVSFSSTRFLFILVKSLISIHWNYLSHYRFLLHFRLSLSIIILVNIHFRSKARIMLFWSGTATFEKVRCLQLSCIYEIDCLRCQNYNFCFLCNC